MEITFAVLRVFLKILNDLRGSVNAVCGVTSFSESRPEKAD